MHASRNLRRLHGAVSERVKFLRDLFQELPSASSKQQSIQLAFIAIELDNLIIGTLRAFLISTFRQGCTTKGVKITVTPSLQDEEQIGAYVLSVLGAVKYAKLNKPVKIARTDEPTIRDPKEVEKVMLACGASNLPALQNALALNSRVFRDVKFVRHFYAHRGQDTFRKAAKNAMAMGILGIRHPDEILRHVLTGRPLTVLEEWLVDTELFFDLLME